MQKFKNTIYIWLFKGVDTCNPSVCGIAASVCVYIDWVLLYVELSSLGVQRQMRVQNWDDATIFHHRQYRTRAG